MLLKFTSFKKITLLVCLVGALVFASASPLDWVTQVVYAADTVAAQSVLTDRISFYNVPSDHKLELHLDYANGKTEKIKYPLTQCAPGTVFTRDLNLYTATFVADGCDPTVFQILNLRWMGDCAFKLEEDPDVRIIARGSYGEVVVVDAHYPAGDLQLANLPAGTTSLAVTMVYTNPQGIVQTGNVEFAFHNPHPGCGPATSPTPTPTPTLTTTVPVETPTATNTPVATNTATPTDAPPGGLSPTATPAATSTPTVTPAVEGPTGLDPVGEPSAQTGMVYLPIVAR